MKRGIPLLAAALAACGDPLIPARAPAYPFADGLTGDVFHWPADRLPVRYWVDPRGALPRLTRAALADWEAQFLYGELRGVLVADSLDADVLVVWGGTVPNDVPPDPGTPVVACNGVTQYTVDSTNTLSDYIRAEINVQGGFTDAQVAACVARTTTHEVGHTIGILNHSPDPADLMNSTPTVPAPSDGDRRTVEVLYHTPPTIAPRP
jgi:hypothetical protein